MQVPVKAVFLDLDDTLFDHASSELCGMAAVRQAYSFLTDRTPQELIDHISTIFEPAWPDVLSGKLSRESWRFNSFRQFLADYDRPPDDSTAAEAARFFRTAYLESRRIIPGAVHLLERLNPRVRVGIITNHLHSDQVDKLEVCGLAPLVHFMVSAESAGVPKPDPRIFEIALHQAGCTPQEAVMFGDSWSSDVLGATGAGIRAVWFNADGRPCPDASLATEVTSLEPVESVLQALLGTSR